MRSVTSASRAGTFLLCARGRMGVLNTERGNIYRALELELLALPVVGGEEVLEGARLSTWGRR